MNYNKTTKLTSKYVSTEHLPIISGLIEDLGLSVIGIEYTPTNRHIELNTHPKKQPSWTIRS